MEPRARETTVPGRVRRAGRACGRRSRPTGHDSPDGLPAGVGAATAGPAEPSHQRLLPAVVPDPCRPPRCRNPEARPRRRTLQSRPARQPAGNLRAGRRRIQSRPAARAAGSGSPGENRNRDPPRPGRSLRLDRNPGGAPAGGRNRASGRTPLADRTPAASRSRGAGHSLGAGHRVRFPAGLRNRRVRDQSLASVVRRQWRRLMPRRRPRLVLIAIRSWPFTEVRTRPLVEAWRPSTVARSGAGAAVGARRTWRPRVVGLPLASWAAGGAFDAGRSALGVRHVAHPGRTRPAAAHRHRTRPAVLHRLRTRPAALHPDAGRNQSQPGRGPGRGPNDL